jgi:hypothetical protein
MKPTNTGKGWFGRSMIRPSLGFALLHFAVGAGFSPFLLGTWMTTANWGVWQGHTPANPVLSWTAFGIVFLWWFPASLILLLSQRSALSDGLVICAFVLQVLVAGYFEANLWRKFWKRLHQRSHTSARAE